MHSQEDISYTKRNSSFEQPGNLSKSKGVNSQVSLSKGNNVKSILKNLGPLNPMASSRESVIIDVENKSVSDAQKQDSFRMDGYTKKTTFQLSRKFRLI
jgi:hypothetical protein